MSIGEKTNRGSSWSRDDDIAFEKALSIYTDETENRWEKIAGVLPGKTLEQVIKHYEILLRDVMMIESGCVSLPEYDSSEGTHAKDTNIPKSCIINRKCEYTQDCKPILKQKRRKGIAWTPDEHSKFLIGLEKYGKGDWRSISRNLVLTRTPTQVASHAQKYFARLNSKNKNKMRQRIHDVDAGESNNTSTMQRPDTSQNARAIQATSQDHHPTYNTPTIWNTQTTLQQPLERPMYGTPTTWNIQAASQPSVDIPIYDTHIVDQSLVGHMVSPFGSNMNRLAPSHMAYGVQHHSAPYSSFSSAPYSSVLSAPFNMAASYNTTYAPTYH
ncbi:Homeodomain-like transcriptional regulator [Raphanus sativus]|uniref:Transcription factor SRM1-like n=1 Tax=Raphanus sativus TaxID=3726 RepID=A0A9W3D2R4_RAPSA|nr:transcription factor SRM1-like [Raphanus sativus]KAJ4865955.1 Homeodomain-like transcriptional regulator [Raphanus sativus]